MTHENELIELLDKETAGQGNGADIEAGEVFRSEAWGQPHAVLPLMLGKGVDGHAVILDLAKAPHLLIAGSAGSGKSVFLDSCLGSLMFKHTPEEVKLILADSKTGEFSKYESLPYLHFPIIKSSKDTLKALQWLMEEMVRRYRLLANACVRNIKELNEQHPGSLPYIIMVIDDLADFMLESRRQMEHLLSRLCALSRAVGIHLIIATQRPDSKVLTDVIKDNFPTRIAFRMASGDDSRRLVDSEDATDLLGHGDMLLQKSCEKTLARIQGIYVKPEESARIVERLQTMYKDMKPIELATLPDLADARPDMALRDRLVEIISDTLGETLDNADDNLGDIAENVADAILEHLDELQEIQG